MLKAFGNELHPDREPLLEANVGGAAHARPVKVVSKERRSSVPVHDQDAHAKFLTDVVQVQADEAKDANMPGKNAGPLAVDLRTRVPLPTTRGPLAAARRLHSLR